MQLPFPHKEESSPYFAGLLGHGLPTPFPKNPTSNSALQQTECLKLCCSVHTSKQQGPGSSLCVVLAPNSGSGLGCRSSRGGGLPLLFCFQQENVVQLTAEGCVQSGGSCVYFQGSVSLYIQTQGIWELCVY